jgi:hypothetical protein
MEANLTEIFNLQGRFTEAEELTMEVLKICEDVYDSEHVTACLSAVVLSRSYYFQGRVEAALLSVAKAFQGYTRDRCPDRELTKGCERRMTELNQEMDHLRNSQNDCLPSTNSPVQTPSEFSGLADSHLRGSRNEFLEVL